MTDPTNLYDQLSPKAQKAVATLCCSNELLPSFRQLLRECGPMHGPFTVEQAALRVASMLRSKLFAELSQKKLPF